MIYFGGVEIVLKLENYVVVVVVDLCEYIKNHWNIYFKRVNRWYVNYILIKLLQINTLANYNEDNVLLATQK